MAEDMGETPDGDDGFILWEGWMFGAVMFPVALEQIRQYPPGNDNQPED
ncbi:hypothetical protein [Roseicella sp. DB1501]|nr:hypothetical protein [Roseicella sp. DB1501]NOG70615.1 hypothetical protein [Roseicella sp. DB1501]